MPRTFSRVCNGRTFSVILVGTIHYALASGSVSNLEDRVADVAQRQLEAIRPYRGDNASPAEPAVNGSVTQTGAVAVGSASTVAGSGCNTLADGIHRGWNDRRHAGEADFGELSRAPVIATRGRSGLCTGSTLLTAGTEWRDRPCLITSCSITR